MKETSGRSLVHAVTDSGKLLLGVIHLKPLPGSPQYGGSLRVIIDAARRDVDTLMEAGFDGFVIENFGDVPFFPGSVPAHVVACMTRIACEVATASAFTVANVLRNDPAAGLALAAAAELDAIRINVHSGAMVTDQGLIEGKAAETLRLRRELGTTTAILADVAVKHAAQLSSGVTLEDSAKDTAYRGLADALIVTGSATGEPTRLNDLESTKRAVPDRPLLVGSGADENNVRELLQIADGLIVGSSLKRDGVFWNEIDPARASQFIKRARA